MQHREKVFTTLLVAPGEVSDALGGAFRYMILKRGNTCRRRIAAVECTTVYTGAITVSARL